MAKILVTGGTGFIGGGLLPMLVSCGHSVYCLTRRDVADYSEEINWRKAPKDVLGLTCLLEEIKPDIVVHLASLFLGSHRPEQATELVESNIAFPSRLLEAMKCAEVTRFVNTGTIFQSTDGSHSAPFNLYAATKQAFEDILHHYARNENFTVLTLRLADTYGIGDTRKKIVQLLIDSALRRETLCLSPGEQELSLTWVDDVRSGFLIGIERLLRRHYPGHEIYGLCNPNLVRVKEIAALVQKLTNSPADYRWGERPYRQGEIMSPVLPESLPGWATSVSLEDGLGRMILSGGY